MMQKSVSKIESYNPDILVHVGDIVESIRGIESFEDYKSNFAIATNIMNNTKIPWILAVGDHGVVPPIFETLSTDRSREQWFLDCCKLFSTPIKDNLYYSKDIDGYHFISLYSLENLRTDPRWGSIFLNKINSEQLSWLKNDLEKNKNSAGIIVVVHHPHWYVWSNWMEVHQLLREYPVIAVIAGHYHYDQDEGTIDGIRYIVMGSSGGVVKDSDAHSGGVQEYAILKIKDSSIEELSLYEVNSDSILEWTSRKSMDRIQAVSCMLDNLWKDVDLIRKDGKIISKNINAVHNNQIELTSLANPIDIPIEIEILFSESILANPVWNKKDLTLIGYEPIILNPGENVGWANYTNVGQWYQPPGIWKAEIISEDINLKHITLTVIVKFHDTMHRFVNRSFTYAIN
ncbi:metallophosphoesterase family protein [Candidatus Neomarinimicrobiota bacterium]